MRSGLPAWARWMLRRLVRPGDRRVLESEMEELDRRRVDRLGPRAAGRRLRSELVSALWRFSVHRLRRLAPSRRHHPQEPYRRPRSGKEEERSMLLDAFTDLLNSK